MSRKPMNLDGQKFYSLTVLETTEQRNNYGRLLYRCRCECGNEVLATAANLKRGEVKACKRCTHLKQAVDITGQRFGRLVAVKRTNSRRGNTYLWECKCDCGNTCYVALNALRNGNTRSCGCLHRESLPNLFLGHVNMAKFEQRDSGKLRSTNTSGVTGVHWCEDRKLWEAEIGFRGKRYHLGRYADFDEAVKVRKAAEDKLYDDFLQWYNEHCRK